MKLAERNTSRMLKTLKRLKLEIASVDDLVARSKEAKFAEAKLVREGVNLLVIFLSAFTEDPIIANPTERNIRDKLSPRQCGLWIRSL